MFQVQIKQRVQSYPLHVPRVYKTAPFSKCRPAQFSFFAPPRKYVLEKARVATRNEAVASVLDDLLTNVFLHVTLAHHDDLVVDFELCDSSIYPLTRHEKEYPENFKSPFFAHASEEVNVRLFGRVPSKIDRFLRKCVTVFSTQWVPLLHIKTVADQFTIPLPALHLLCASVYGLHHATHPRAWGQYFPYFEAGYKDNTLYIRLSSEFLELAYV